jgi:hypothetical protein
MPLSQIETASLSTGLVAPTATALSTSSGSAPSYSARAWVNFNGTSSGNLTGTYSQSGTTMTVAITNHGLTAGQVVYLTFQTGTAGAETFTVVSVTNSDVFVVTSVTSRTTSGNCTANFNVIRASGNVSSIVDNGVGDYTANFTIAMPDANYSVAGGAAYSSDPASGPSAARYVSISTQAAPTATTCRFISAYANGGKDDCTIVCLSIFR